VIRGRRRPSCVRATGDPGKPARTTDRRTLGHGRRDGSGYADRPPSSPAALRKSILNGLINEYSRAEDAELSTGTGTLHARPVP